MTAAASRLDLGPVLPPTSPKLKPPNPSKSLTRKKMLRNNQTNFFSLRHFSNKKSAAGPDRTDANRYSRKKMLPVIVDVTQAFDNSRLAKNEEYSQELN